MAVIAIDFDGTCVTHDFPEVGKEIGSEPVLRALVENGHKLILNTMRSHKSEKTTNASDHGMTSTERDVLQEAVDWFAERNIPLYGINENPDQHKWTDSPKVFAHVYIDDAALGVPLAVNSKLSQRAFVDWSAVAKMLHQIGAITIEQYKYCKEQYQQIHGKS